MSVDRHGRGAGGRGHHTRVGRGPARRRRRARRPRRRPGAAAPAQPAGPVPRLANGKPDLSGHWDNPYTPNMALRVVDPETREPLKFARQGEAIPGAMAPASGQAPRTFDLPFTEWGLKKWKEYDPVRKGDYAGNCLPFGMSRNINSPHGVQMLHHPDALAFLFEQNTWHTLGAHYRQLQVAGRPARDLERHSVGRWDGDTLVIETGGFNGYTKLDTAGHPHSKELKLTNTFLRTDSQTMTHTVTVHDPKAYTRDWMNVRTGASSRPTTC